MCIPNNKPHWSTITPPTLFPANHHAYAGSRHCILSPPTPQDYLCGSLFREYHVMDSTHSNPYLILITLVCGCVCDLRIMVCVCVCERVFAGKPLQGCLGYK